MKNTLSIIVIGVSLVLFSCKKESSSTSKSISAPQKNQNISYLENNSPTTIGVEKGKRKYCTEGSLKICCGRSWCLVTPLSDYDQNTTIQIADYFQGTLEKINSSQLKLIIPFNKISTATYNDWFINNTFVGEYFPISETIANQIGLSNIAISEGSYPVNEITNVGYEIIINYQQQIIE